MSTITSVDTLLYKQIVPLADTGASTALATVVPSVKFKLDTCSMAPQANTVTKPSPSGFVAVTFNDTATTPLAGTSPARSVTRTSRMLLPPIFVFGTSRNASGLLPARVSRTRAGAIAGEAGSCGEPAVDVDDQIDGGQRVEADGPGSRDGGDDRVGHGLPGHVVDVRYQVLEHRTSRP